MVYIIIFLIIILLILASPLGIDIKYLRKNKKDKFIIKFKFLWNLIKIPLNIERNLEVISEIKEERKINFNYLKLLNMSPIMFKEFLFLLRRFKGRIVCTSVNIKVDFSFDDVALTGLGSGLLWSSIGTGLTLMKDFLKLKEEACISINPEFKDGFFFDTKIDVKLKVKLIHVLLSSISMIKIFISSLCLKFMQKKRKKAPKLN